MCEDMEIGDTHCAIATAMSAGDGEVKAVSTRQLKKIRRAGRDPVERQAKKRKSKQEAKSAARFRAEVPKYSFVNGSGEGILMYPIIVRETLFLYRQTNNNEV